MTRDPRIQVENQAKIDRWAAFQKTSRKLEGMRLELDPIFYSGIASKKKGYEGRAPDFDNDRRYYDLEGKRVTFTLSRRDPEVLEEWARRGLHPNSIMSGFVGKVLFAPTVQAMFEITGDGGRTFQPQIDEGDETIVRLRRAGVYYGFPNYPERIRQNGFIGIEFLRMHYFGIADAGDDSYIFILS